jgi:hypothetical protein
VLAVFLIKIVFLRFYAENMSLIFFAGIFPVKKLINYLIKRTL